MELYLQFGHGMMDHCRHLIEVWDGGTVILSPRDSKPNQLSNIAGDICGLHNGKVLFDPQFYLPHADHARLRFHDYWPTNYQTGTFWQNSSFAQFMQKLKALNNSLGAEAIILPGLLATQIDDRWLQTQNQIFSAARQLFPNEAVFVTIALTEDVARDNAQVQHLLEESESWTPDGYYLVIEHPKGDYLVDDVGWLVNVLDIASGLRLRGAKVVLGYCNHQMLIAACAKPTAICSGTWMNVRSFPPEKFQAATAEVKNKSTWYYCPRALSEYKIPTLGIAHRLGILDELRPSGHLNNSYIASVFAGSQPSKIGFTEPLAFRHYLYCLREQNAEAVKASFDETVAYHEAMLDQTEVFVDQLHAQGIKGQNRDFKERGCFDANREALAAFITIRGPVLRRRWAAI